MRKTGRSLVSKTYNITELAGISLPCETADRPLFLRKDSDGRVRLIFDIEEDREGIMLLPAEGAALMRVLMELYPLEALSQI